jgi:hypothetical protein
MSLKLIKHVMKQNGGEYEKLGDVVTSDGGEGGELKSGGRSHTTEAPISYNKSCTKALHLNNYL